MRVDGWQKRLRAVFADARTRKFQWGEHDCVTFAASAAQAVTGIDYPQQVRDLYQWSSAREAIIVIEEAGGLEAMVSEILGPAVAYGSCGAGDIVLAVNLERELLAVHDGYSLFAASEQGFNPLPISAARVGWRL